MISNRNVRVIVSVFAIFAVITFLATSQSSFGNSVQRVNSPSNGDAIFQQEQESNTLRGKPYHGNQPPYSQDEKTVPVKGGNSGKDKIIADKSTSEKLGEYKNEDEDTKIVVEKATDKENNGGVDGACNEVDYVVMIDAGSTGSRVHVYEFNTCKSPPVLLSEKFEMLKPGLSSFDTDTKGAAASLDPLLKVAMETVPKAKQGCTPVAVKATAGLRMLGDEKAKSILDEIRSHMENDYPFAVVDGEGISIMDGKDEGVYAWITTNYLLGNIGSSEMIPTAAVFDLGGGSTQIVFEPEFGNDEKMVDGEHKYEFTFGDRKFTLYQFSHLGFGLMQGRNKVNGLVVESKLTDNKELANSKFNSEKAMKDAKATTTITNPCMAPGVTAQNVQVKLADDEYYLVNMKGPSVAAGAQCRFLAEKVLNKDAECTTKPCSFNGIHQPSLTKAFRKSSDMYVFSFFYDRTNPLGFPSSFTVEELSDLAKVVCNGDLLWKDVLLDESIKELNEEPHWCLDLSFITAMLHTGYDIPFHRELRTANKINNNELGWCLGASLPLLDKTNSNWKCKVEKVN